MLPFVGRPIVTQPTATRTDLGAAWGGMLDRVGAMVGLHIPRLPAIAPLLVAIRAWLFHSIGRLDRLALRWQSGTLPRPRPPRTAPSRAAPPADTPADAGPPARPRIRTHRFWLIRLVQPTAQYGGELAHLLTRDDIRALVQAAPQAGRLIRPLCRAFAVPEPDWLRRPPRPKPPRPEPPPAQPSTPRPRKPRLPPGYLPGMLPTDRPLPQRVIDAVRHDKKTGRWRPA